MKKVLYFAALLLTMTLTTSCEKEEVGGTSMESMAGQWYCTVDAIDDSGNPIDGGEDYWGVGRTLILTYNVSDNNTTQMWINNLGIGNFAKDYNYPGYPDYDMCAKVSCDQNSFSFSSNESANVAEPVIWSHEEVDPNDPEKKITVIDAQVDPMPVTIEGRILKGAAHQNNGSVCDSIIMYVVYKNDPWYPDDGYTKYKISGIRYSGLAEND